MKMKMVESKRPKGYANQLTKWLGSEEEIRPFVEPFEKYNETKKACVAMYKGRYAVFTKVEKFLLFDN